MKSKIAQRILDRTKPETKKFVKHYAALTKRIHDIMQAKGISQKELAERLAKRPSEVNKWMNNQHNLTLKTIAKLEVALGEELITVPQLVVVRKKQKITMTVKPLGKLKMTAAREERIIIIPSEQLQEKDLKGVMCI